MTGIAVYDMNRVMATRSVSLHEQQVETTRTRIVDAVAELIVEEHPATLSVPAVAARAGVSLRTVYRYFPTKQALIDAVANVGNQQTRVAFPEEKLRYADLPEYMPLLWAELEGTRALVKAQQATPLGQEIARTRAQRRTALIQRVVADEQLGLPPDDEQRLTAMIALLCSRTALFELTDVLDLSVEEAAKLAVWTTQAIVETARRTKEVGR